MAVSLKLSVRWVPGTSNRLILQTLRGEFQVSLEKFEAVFGRPATFDLYLKGKTTLEMPEQHLKTLGV